MASLPLHPIPPIADGAPEWNVFRLAEAATALDIRVVSPCLHSQISQLRSYPRRGKYDHVDFSDGLFAFIEFLTNRIFPVRLLARRLAKLPDLVAWLYLRRVSIWLAATRPDIVVINARPQYVRYLRKFCAGIPLLLFMRGPLGESSRYLGLLDGILVNSRGMLSYARQLVPQSGLRIWKIPNSLGGEFQLETQESDRFTRPDLSILFIGRLVKEKGVLELLEAFRLVLRELPKARLVLCGASDNYAGAAHKSAYEREVLHRAKSFLPGQVVLAGYVPNTCLSPRLGQSALAVFPSMPSIYVESFGMVALEAMRCHTPVVASRQPGFEELVIPGKTGLLIEDPSDTRSLADAMLQVLRNPQLARRMGEAGYRRSLNYTPEAAARRFEEIAGEVLAQTDSVAHPHVLGVPMGEKGRA